MAKTSKKTSLKFMTKPTAVALVSGGVKPGPHIVVGSRRIAVALTAGATIVEEKRLFWSQISHVVAAKDDEGALHLTTSREADEEGYEIVAA